ncbi:protein of unknown function (plasmid) [Shinella sp. WSC3-e]|nr:hypothetical protein SHINE37_80142 [Rhizobiaceae bacterium]CAK7262069.1 protein of unknown function [Shinella sp. WSC3-e]
MLSRQGDLENVANLIFHGSTMRGCPQAQTLLQTIIQIPDRHTCHGLPFLSAITVINDCIDGIW